LKLSNLKDFTRGWFIGHFEPSIIKTDDFEVGVLTHPKGEYWAPHHHKIAQEINVLLSGSMSCNGKLFAPGDIFVFEPNEVCTPTFHEDCKILVVKVPSVRGDKYESN